MKNLIKNTALFVVIVFVVLYAIAQTPKNSGAIIEQPHYTCAEAKGLLNLSPDNRSLQREAFLACDND